MNDAPLPFSTPGDRERLLLMARAAGLAAAGPAPTRVGPRPAEAATPVPMSAAQQRMWLVAQLPGGSAAHHVVAGWQLAGELDAVVLRRALDGLVARHEALRTTFRETGGELWQDIASAGSSSFDLDEHDLRDLPGPGDRDAALDRLLERTRNRPFDLSRGPLIRGTLVWQGADSAVLLLVLHHIVTDGWSTELLFRELAALYAAFAGGQPAPLTPPAVQYPDFALWQRDRIADGTLDSQRDHWRAALADAPHLSGLPVDRARPPHQDFAGARSTFVLDADLTRGLRQLAQRHGTTMFQVLLAGWAAALIRWSGEPGVVVGMPFAGRDRDELAGTFGLFVNTLAVHLDASDRPTVAEWLARTRDRALAAQAHADLPFEQVVDLAGAERSASHSPLVQNLFSWQDFREQPLDLPGVHGVPLEQGPAATAQFDLLLTAGEHGDRIEGAVQYATALFDADTVRRCLDSWRHLLAAMASGEDLPVDGLPLLDAAEQALVLALGVGAPAPRPHRPTLHGLFEAQAVRKPDATAIVSSTGSLTYRDLNARANRLAHRLRALGVRPDDRVALHAARTPDAVAGLLAILKAGAGYVPLDPDWPAARQRDLLADCAPAALLISGGEQQDAGIPVVDLREEQPYPDHDPEPAAGPEHLAYVIYTSGSTGRPQGVMVEHRHVVASVTARVEAYPVPQRSLSLLPIASDSSVAGVFGPLTSGGALVLVDAPDRPAAELVRQRVDTLLCVPSQYSAILADLADLADLAELADLDGPPPGLVTAIVAGEVCPPELIAESRRVLPGVALHNEYGPAEATEWATHHDCGPGTPGRTVPIGRPIAGARVHVLDALRRPVPAGVPGELHIGGSGVARGYLGRPGLTAERFLPDPFVPGERMYRTGDIARRRPDGALEYLGRSDDQIKLRGHRIEPGEIVHHLTRHPDIAEAAVVVHGDRLVGYYTAARPLDAAALRLALAQRLPGHLLPAALVHLDALPRTPGGKLDRRALPVPDDTGHVRRADEEPQGEIERTVAVLWAELLKVERVGRHDDFFDLGGHSLLGVLMIARLRDELGVELELSTLFAAPTPAGCAAAIARARPVDRQGITARPHAGRAPLSFPQLRLWFLAQLDGASSAYHLPLALRLSGPLDRAALQTALDRVLARHESLRTRFVLADGEPEQHIDDPAPFPLVHHDLTGATDAAAEQQRLVAAEAAAPFDLVRGPLVRGRLIALGAQEHTLLLTLHHIVCDGWSVGVLLRELGSLYAAARGSGVGTVPVPVPEPAVQYPDFALWQREQLTPENTAPQADYWRRTLAGAPAVCDLPADRPRPARQDFAGGMVPCDLDVELTDRLKALGRRNGTTLFTLLLAGWAALISRLSGQQEVVIGTASAGRGQAGTESAIGVFTNMLPLRLDTGGTPSVAEWLERVTTAMLDAHANEDLPFERIVELVRPDRSLAHNAVFQVAITWQEGRDERLDLPGVRAERLSGQEHRTATFDLTLALHESDGAVTGGIEYASALFDPATVRRFAEHWLVLLAAMARDDASALDDLPLLRLADLDQLREWNDTAAGEQDARPLHELVAEQAVRTPEAVAVAHGTRHTSYRDLTERAAGIATALEACGVLAGDRVAIVLERSADLIAAELAVLTLGAAYVPIDPVFPQQRQAFLIEDSGARVVLARPGAAVPTVAAVPRVDLADEPGTAPVSHGADLARAPRVSDAADAYVMYTSGSSGRPKGVAATHRGVRRLLRDNRYADFRAGDRIAFAANPAFDASTMEVWAALANGACAVVVDQADLLDPVRFARVLREQGITALFLTTSLFHRYAEPVGQALAGLRHLLVGGDVMDPRILRRFLADHRPEHFVHVYGPTETTTFALAHELTDLAADAVRVPIGRPIAGTTVHILDRWMRPQPIGVVGELYIGGQGVAREYVNRPELTAERFVQDPFAADGSRLYRTGDLGRRLLDGTIEFLGRDDLQVKIRGFRIEPGEIETALAEHPAIAECVVATRSTPETISDDKRLVAYYVVASDAATPTAAALRAHLATRLPEYMVPTAYVRLDALPLNPNGKVDRPALPEPGTESYFRERYEAPLDGLESTLAAIWSELLHVRGIGRHDDFFHLGGHSLLAVQLFTRLRADLGIEVALETLFATPTLAGFARAVDAARPSEQPPIVHVPHTGVLPQSSAQQQLWFLSTLGRRSPYHIPGGFRLTGPLDPEALRRALERVVERHEVLRTTFADTDGQAVQRIAAHGSPGWADHDLRGRADAAGEHERLVDPGGPRALRPGTRTPDPRAPDPAGRGRAHAAADAAPHRRRRLVDQPAAARADRVLHRRVHRGGRPARAARRAVRRLRALAARPAGRTRSRRSRGLLGAHPVRCARAVHAARRPPPAGRAGLPRRLRRMRPGRRTRRPAQGGEQAPRTDAVHGAARRMVRDRRAARRPERRRDRHAHRQPGPSRGPGPDRAVRHHAADPPGHLRRSHGRRMA